MSDHTILNNFVVGDVNNSSACDFMKCEFDCLPNTDIKGSENIYTYNENFMMLNSDKIIQKIKSLMKNRHFYKKKELFSLINTPKKYPTSQIYYALSQMIDDKTEYVLDKYNRNGNLTVSSKTQSSKI